MTRPERCKWQALLKEDHSIWKDASDIEQRCSTVSSCAVLTNDQPSPAPPRRKWDVDQDMQCARQMLRLFDAHISHSEDLASNSSTNSRSRSDRQRASTTHDLQLANANIGNLLLTTLRLCLGNLEVTHARASPSTPSFFPKRLVCFQGPSAASDAQRGVSAGCCRLDCERVWGASAQHGFGKHHRCR